MNIERYNRLVKTFNSKRYLLKLRDNTIRDKKTNRILEEVILENGMRTVKLNYDGKEYTYGLHEIVSMWIRSVFVNLECYFIDNDKGNCHPSNLIWHKEGEGLIVDKREQGKQKYELTKEEEEYIFNAKVGGGSMMSYKKLMVKFNVPFYIITNIRTGKRKIKKKLTRK